MEKKNNNRSRCTDDRGGVVSRRPFVLDMETSDPDDFLTLLLLLGHPHVDLKAITITPGTKEQVGLVRQVLSWFEEPLEEEKENDKEIEKNNSTTTTTAPQPRILVGAHDIHHKGNCVSAWHYKAFPQLTRTEALPDGEGWEILKHCFVPGTTMVEGAAPKNLGMLFQNFRALFHNNSSSADESNQKTRGQQQRNDCGKDDIRQAKQKPVLGRLFFQGGFAGEGVVPREKQLQKFLGMEAVSSFNPGGDISATRKILEASKSKIIFDDDALVHFISKNVCHGVMYDFQMHQVLTQHLEKEMVKAELSSNSSVGLKAFLTSLACCRRGKKFQPSLNENSDSSTVNGTSIKHLLSLQLIHQGMSEYLSFKANGKAFHDPLAACCAINPKIGEWKEVEMSCSAKGAKWSSVLATPLSSSQSGNKCEKEEKKEGGYNNISPIVVTQPNAHIIVDYRHDLFIKTLLGGGDDADDDVSKDATTSETPSPISSSVLSSSAQQAAGEGKELQQEGEKWCDLYPELPQQGVQQQGVHQGRKVGVKKHRLQ